MIKLKKHLSRGSLIIISLTLVLFMIAPFLEGKAHDIMLELGIFLISVKLILMTYKNSVSEKKILEKLDMIYEELSKDDSSSQTTIKGKHRGPKVNRFVIEDIFMTK